MSHTARCSPYAATTIACILPDNTFNFSTTVRHQFNGILTVLTLRFNQQCK